MDKEFIYCENYKKYNTETELAIKEAREGINLSGPYENIEELMEALDSEDE